VIADMAQLYDNVILRRSEAGKVVVLHKQKYEEVKTHTARRSFITIALTVYKLPASIVMRITGHKSEKQLFEYARITKEEAALMMSKAMEQYLFNSLLNT
jgi:integrase